MLHLSLELHERILIDSLSGRLDVFRDALSRQKSSSGVEIDILIDGGRRKGELEQEQFVGMAMEILVSNCIISLVKDKCGTRLSSAGNLFC